MLPVDVVTVSYNSRHRLRDCVEPLAGMAGVHVFVVDNASTDGSLESVADLPVTRIAMPRNGGFSYGCNAGWRAGRAPFVLFLNPDAGIDEASLQSLARVLEDDPDTAACGPTILDGDGHLHHSQRRFPRLASTFAQALFLHRLLPRAAWTDELVRDPETYGRRGSPDWISGACFMVRRDILERLGGMDEGFFLYSEDTDLCRRVRDLGLEVHFVPEAVCRHAGGGSAPRPALLPVLAASHLRYARKHGGPMAALLTRLGIVLGALSHALVGRGGHAARAGHARVLHLALLGGLERAGRAPDRR